MLCVRRRCHFDSDFLHPGVVIIRDGHGAGGNEHDWGLVFGVYRAEVGARVVVDFDCGQVVAVADSNGNRDFVLAVRSVPVVLPRPCSCRVKAWQALLAKRIAGVVPCLYDNSRVWDRPSVPIEVLDRVEVVVGNEPDETIWAEKCGVALVWSLFERPKLVARQTAEKWVPDFGRARRTRPAPSTVRVINSDNGKADFEVKSRGRVQVHIHVVILLLIWISLDYIGVQPVAGSVLFILDVVRDRQCAVLVAKDVRRVVKWQHPEGRRCVDRLEVSAFGIFARGRVDSHGAAFVASFHFPKHKGKGGFLVVVEVGDESYQIFPFWLPGERYRSVHAGVVLSDVGECGAGVDGELPQPVAVVNVDDGNAERVRDCGARPRLTFEHKLVLVWDRVSDDICDVVVLRGQRFQLAENGVVVLGDVQQTDRVEVVNGYKRS